MLTLSEKKLRLVVGSFRWPVLCRVCDRAGPSHRVCVALLLLPGMRQIRIILHSVTRWQKLPGAASITPRFRRVNCRCRCRKVRLGRGPASWSSSSPARELAPRRPARARERWRRSLRLARRFGRHGRHGLTECSAVVLLSSPVAWSAVQDTAPTRRAQLRLDAHRLHAVRDTAYSTWIISTKHTWIYRVFLRTY